MIKLSSKNLILKNLQDVYNIKYKISKAKLQYLHILQYLKSKTDLFYFYFSYSYIHKNFILYKYP